MKGSPKTKTPTQTAVTGSVAPSTEVRWNRYGVQACTNVMLDTTVGKKANKTKVNKRGQDLEWLDSCSCLCFMKIKRY